MRGRRWADRGGRADGTPFSSGSSRVCTIRVMLASSVGIGYGSSRGMGDQMSDTLTKEERSKRMSLIRGRDTKPEMLVRRLVHALGYRYRLHCSDVPGKPDLVFRSRRKVIFVHGCFWHLHKGCANNRMPKSRLDFWKPKLEANRKRDIRNKARLSRTGWTYLVIWECETACAESLEERIREFLESERT